MKKLSIILISIFIISFSSCEEDEDCKDCKIIVETLDDDGNIISTEEKSHQQLCEEELYEAESQDPTIIDNRKSYWSCN